MKKSDRSGHQPQQQYDQARSGHQSHGGQQACGQRSGSQIYANGPLQGRDAVGAQQRGFDAGGGFDGQSHQARYGPAWQQYPDPLGGRSQGSNHPAQSGQSGFQQPQQGHNGGQWEPRPNRQSGGFPGSRDNPGVAQGGGQNSQDQALDPDYLRWRTQHMQALDNDYRQWRGERHKKFSDAFDHWRKSRAAATPATTGADTDNAAGSSNASNISTAAPGQGRQQHN